MRPTRSRMLTAGREKRISSRPSRTRQASRHRDALFSNSTDGARPRTAMDVAMAEIHWSWSNGNPLWKYGWNLGARLRTYHEPSAHWVSSRSFAPFWYAALDTFSAPTSVRAHKVSPVA